MSNKVKINKLDHKSNIRIVFNNYLDTHQEYYIKNFNLKNKYYQYEYPLDKIISYMKTKIKYKLRILDLGCGRNLIKQHFKLNSNLNIIGYDRDGFNGSKICDIANLDEESYLIDICIFNQSLVGSNWLKYLDEGQRVLRCNGEMIISDSIEKFDIVKEYLAILEMKIINTDHDENKIWFYINAIKDHK